MFVADIMTRQISYLTHFVMKNAITPISRKLYLITRLLISTTENRGTNYRPGQRLQSGDPDVKYNEYMCITFRCSGIARTFICLYRLMC